MSYPTPDPTGKYKKSFRYITSCWRHGTFYIGRRGAFLLLFGVAFYTIGYSAFAFPVLRPDLKFPHEYLHPWIRLVLWCLAATIACVCAFRRAPGKDIPGFVALCLPVAERVVSYVIGIGIALILPGYEGLLRTGIAGAIVYLVMLFAIMVVASWPDPRPEFFGKAWQVKESN